MSPINTPRAVYARLLAGELESLSLAYRRHSPAFSGALLKCAGVVQTDAPVMTGERADAIRAAFPKLFLREFERGAYKRGNGERVAAIFDKWRECIASCGPLEPAPYHYLATVVHNLGALFGVPSDKTRAAMVDATPLFHRGASAYDAACAIHTSLCNVVAKSIDVKS